MSDIPAALRYVPVPDGTGGYRHELRTAPPGHDKAGRKHIPDPIKANAESSAQQLKLLVERVEAILGEIAEAQTVLADTYAQAKSRGYDVRTLKAIVSIRRKDRSSLLEEEALLETYRAALGIE